MRVPITKDNETKGNSGKVATAIASESGEFLAKVVKFKAIISFFSKFIIVKGH